MGHLKGKELIKKTRQELLDELAGLEKKLFELKGQKAASAAATKLTEIKNTRRDVARVKSILMVSQRKALQEKYAKAKLVPIDLRKHQEKSLRNKLAPKYANKLTAQESRRHKCLFERKFALKAQ
ncbi:ribosomal protein L29, putative [Trichomonas vaginalis G3]|uniref:Ribosomal protein L29, putative n=1 Tax=Trichomonas vaginalis (strain ATCC PRA-98 / G3) TaxID=412133 RepID=A2E6R2_TRIV3|nr:ribosomal protein family [Trichomonas vaginalis G3]EAY11656.1 ribosomal protein L29, putative [Trichomonas vaginalis G3]KAI5494939.1 ribosomal protein family [Trichomonas vaginalis G3]5XY3_h Chain h, Ribosomal protein L29, putative [Trichomonas vaginalis]|eukprot:XP_001323879.1 ribosomal protein L29 [Trichomonas vaginalis G3]